MIYLASPYSHPEAQVREERYRAAVKKAAELMVLGKCVFSPIAHTHEIGIEIGREVDHDFWMRQDRAILRHCATVYVLMIPGWRESRGIAEEISMAERIGIPVEYIIP